jgi:hypothetical protein
MITINQPNGDNTMTTLAKSYPLSTYTRVQFEGDSGILATLVKQEYELSANFNKRYVAKCNELNGLCTRVKVMEQTPESVSHETIYMN